MRSVPRLVFKTRRALETLGDPTPCMQTNDLHVGRSSARPGATTEQDKAHSYNRVQGPGKVHFSCSAVG
jgi:hypothetical protein